MSARECVVILHGIFRTSRHMRKLAASLAAHGYETLNIDYPSTRYPLEQLAKIIRETIESRAEEYQKVHFVGYSMGGLVLRTLLTHYRPDQMGRVVLLAPPNKGSEVADFLKNNWLYKKLYGPAGQQLITDQASFSHLFGAVDYECGVIAGSFSVDPVSSLLIKGVGDGKVSVENTKIDGMCDHIVVHASHTFFPHNHHVQRQTLHFLRNGSFQHTSLVL